MTIQNSPTTLLLIGVLCVLVAIANGDFNQYGVKFGNLSTNKRWGVGIFGLVLMIPSLWLNLRSQPEKKPEAQSTPPTVAPPAPNCDASVTGSAATSGANSPATVAGCTGPSSPAKP